MEEKPIQHMNANDLFATLKKILKTKKITYKHLAEGLDISESTLKSIFYQKNATVKRILDICEYINFPFPELVKLSYRHSEEEFELTYEQEKFFANNPHYYYFFREHFFQRKDLDQICKQHKITKRSCYLYLRKLEKIGLLDLYPNNKVKYKISGKQRWLSDGPWFKKFLCPFLNNILKEIQGSSNELNYTNNIGFATISKEVLTNFIFEINQVEKKFKEIAYQDYLINRHKDGVDVSWSFNFACMDIFGRMTQIINLDS